MSLFSHRKGLKRIRDSLQMDSMDTPLRNRLWNALDGTYWGQVQPHSSQDLHFYEPLHRSVILLWHHYFKWTLDTINRYWPTTLGQIRKEFFGSAWNEVYDFIEFVANHFEDTTRNKRFMETCNAILQSELSAYRFVAGRITQLTSEEEIGEIERAINVAPEPVGLHLRTALERLADRKSPDYRNSIKESISAVEALCVLISEDPKASLGHALKKVKLRVPIHPAMEKAFEHLYGYSSNEDGIRHAMLDVPDVDFADAKFMLVSCSAFTSYLISKSERAEITRKNTQPSR